MYFRTSSKQKRRLKIPSLRNKKTTKINTKIQQVEEELTRRHSSHALVTMKSLGQISKKKKKEAEAKASVLSLRKTAKKKKRAINLRFIVTTVVRLTMLARAMKRKQELH